MGKAPAAAWAAVAAGLLAAVPAQAQPVVAVGGRVEHASTLGVADLQKLPPVTVVLTARTGQGLQTSSFTGALLWSVLDQAAPIDETGPRSRLQHTMLARGRDGYAVALAIGEVSPEFEGKQVLIAYAQDDKPLTELRLVVPQDSRAGRSVRDLVAIEVR